MAPAKSASPILGWRELPRASRARRRALERRPTWLRSNWRASKSPPGATSTRWVWSSTKSSPASAPSKIGRASCRERGEISGGAGSFKKKKEDEQSLCLITKGQRQMVKIALNKRLIQRVLIPLISISDYVLRLGADYRRTVQSRHCVVCL